MIHNVVAVRELPWTYLNLFLLCGKKERFTRQATASLNLAQLMSKIAIRRF